MHTFPHGDRDVIETSSHMIILQNHAGKALNLITAVMQFDADEVMSSEYLHAFGQGKISKCRLLSVDNTVLFSMYQITQILGKEIDENLLVNAICLVL